MANTGYKINPQVIQIFTTGPNSGSIVSSSFTTTFNSGSGFVSSSICNQLYYYKVFDPYNCVVPLFCVSPIIYTITPQSCDSSSFDYVYNFALGAGPNPIPEIRVEYSLTSDFTGEIKGTTITDYIGSTIAPLSVNITNGLTNRSEISSSGLLTLPLNKYSSVYFRAYSICSGSNSSSYSNIQEGKCINPPTTLPVSPFSFEGHWSSDDTLHKPWINSWVDYKDEYGTIVREIIGGIENGCQTIMASSIIKYNGCNPC